MKRLFIILTLFLLLINTFAYSAESIVKKDIKYVTPDGFSIYAQFSYPKSKTQTDYKTVIFLHSLGYSSEWWENLPDEFLKDGYATLLVDLRGHGKSVYNSKLVRISWKNLTNKAYAKYPDDVVGLIKFIQNENPKKHFFNEFAIIGSDIGASTGILASNALTPHPKTIIMLSPVVKAKGLYIPVKYAELNDIDVLSICGANDTSSLDAQDYLKRFAQANFVEYVSESKNSGMLLLKNDKSIGSLLIKWIDQYLK